MYCECLQIMIVNMIHGAAPTRAFSPEVHSMSYFSRAERAAARVGCTPRGKRLVQHRTSAKDILGSVSWGMN